MEKLTQACLGLLIWSLITSVGCNSPAYTHANSALSCPQGTHYEDSDAMHHNICVENRENCKNFDIDTGNCKKCEWSSDMVNSVSGNYCEYVWWKMFLVILGVIILGFLLLGFIIFGLKHVFCPSKKKKNKLKLFRHKEEKIEKRRNPYDYVVFDDETRKTNNMQMSRMG